MSSRLVAHPGLRYDRMLPRQIRLASDVQVAYCYDDQPFTPLQKRHLDDGDLEPERLRAWFAVAEYLAAEPAPVSIWTARQKRRYPWSPLPSPEEFRWNVFLAEFQFESWCHSALLVNAQTFRSHIEASGAVLTLEWGLLVAGNLQPVVELLNRRANLEL